MNSLLSVLEERFSAGKCDFFVTGIGRKKRYEFFVVGMGRDIFHRKTWMEKRFTSVNTHFYTYTLHFR